MVWYDDPILVTAVLLVVIVAAGTVIFAMRRFERKPKPAKKPTQQPDPDLQYSANLPVKYSKSIQTEVASNAKNELRMLDLEREILGDAIRRLYEAQGEGKITEAERDKLASTYKDRMNKIKDSISRDEGIVALHELEGMQEDLMKLFSERFGELTNKVEELRTRIDVKPIREIPVRLIKQPPTQMEKEDEGEDEEEEKEVTEVSEGEDEKRRKVKRKQTEEKPSKNEGERRIDAIYSEVNKALEKLGQMEAEA